MSSNIGMIEWVNDTKPLRSCIEEQLRDKLPLSKAIESHRMWISRFRGDTMGKSVKRMISRVRGPNSCFLREQDI